ncbi:serine/threonine-protein kinase [Streptomyces sp. yr375]|uniref:serine/threonine-protein kinase n=1 Tax=Streptomyces sp. yr375 TaxID=1761906 RepID=UPI000B879901|nr:serine/threonine-protein kinase [Streptomyces sp. yr375]
MSEESGSERLIAGRYRLLTPLGEGGMGTVWRALDEVLHREVAVKEVRAPHGLSASDVERLYARLEREAWAAARVANRNVVTVYDVATQDGRPWIVMEIVRGISLAELLDAEGPLEPARAAHIGAEVLAALRAAHEAGVLHRDVKPANVLLSNDGRVVLTDFGIATVEGTSALTMTGEVIGSPEFLAPERALGRTPGPESDLWSLGVLLYAAVEGNSPFRYDTPLSTLRAIVDEELPPPRRAGPLTPVIEGLLRKDPAERMPADTAERDLRIVAAGGDPYEGTAPTTPQAPYTPYPPTAATPAEPFRQQPSPTPPQPWTAAPAGSSPEPPQRNRRAGVALVAGVAVLALAVAGLTYGLLNRGDGSGGKATGGVTDSGTDIASSPASQPETSDETAGESPSASPSPSPSESASSEAPAQTVEVTVAGANTDYSGSCPPADADAPAFTATITVGQVPATVSYRWVSKDGELSGQTWKTLDFPSGGGKSQQDKVTVSTYAGSGTYQNAIGVEVREPVTATSEKVPFSVTCETEAPTDGTSPSPSPSE